jgi:Fic family protein
LAARIGISQPTADRALSELQQLGIVHEHTGRRRNRLFVFKDYYDLFVA